MGRHQPTRKATARQAEIILSQHLLGRRLKAVKLPSSRRRGLPETARGDEPFRDRGDSVVGRDKLIPPACWRGLLGVVYGDLVDHGAISVRHQMHVDLGILLNLGRLDHLPVGRDDLDRLADDKVHRLARPGVNSDRRSWRIIGHGSRTIAHG